ncbi:imm11 family protein [Parasphingorhabdus halotolerans]|uniref:Immunity MXAN-0049 protein domain-containing protein n=1 Tax=Parasphingorhabdus halotolerans TaxID=2725558 RepID=A0A6H2DKC6_9SPHN|nr:DUF1629 domain-containing protein [Parasphingorhabdus halotolerans]QJB69119.1 hypothetical protein HF685_07330 [Parasphingorhabdus halotolerans]
MSKEIVWASNAMINPAMLRPIRHDLAESGEINKQKSLLAAKENPQGKALSKEYFPDEIFVAKDANTNYENLPHLFYAYGYWVVSGEVADVMRQFDLGGCNLYPTNVFRKDRKTSIGDKWFCLNFGNVKQAFIGNESTAVSKFGSGTTDRWNAPTILKDGQLVVRSSALSGPDIWIDAKIFNIFFVSNRLARALKAAKVATPFGLKKCVIVG